MRRVDHGPEAEQQSFVEMSIHVIAVSIALSSPVTQRFGSPVQLRIVGWVKVHAIYVGRTLSHVLARSMFF